MSYNIKERADSVLSGILQKNPFTEPDYKPFIYIDAISQKNMFGSEVVDLRKIYPEAKCGDTAYGVFRISPIYDKEIYISIRDNTALFVDGEMLFDGSGSGEYKFFTITAKKDGSTEVMIKAVCRADAFSFEYSLTTPEYKFMWTKDYSFCMRKTLPIPEFFGEEGIAFSTLFNSSEKDKMKVFETGNHEFVFPQASQKNEFKDFAKLYSAQKGKFAYAVSYAKEATTLKIASRGILKVFVNGIEKEYSGNISLAEGDCIVIKSQRSDDKWGFSCDDRCLSVPFLATERNHGTEWLMIGLFGDENDSIDTSFEVEKNLDFKKPYNGNEGKTFFRFPDGISYLRPYQNTSFCGQWYYAVMCGHFGLMKYAKTFNDEFCLDYFNKSIKILADFYEYAMYDKIIFKNDTSILPRSTELDILDNIGTMGLNAAEEYLINNDDKVKELLLVLSDALSNVPISENGAFHRKTTMWADDLFMAVPFLLRLWLVTKEEKYLDTASKQLLEYKRLMFMEDENIFSHIYFVEKERASRVPWGRGNGWVMVALSEFLEIVPEEYIHYEDIKNIFVSMSAGIRNLQRDAGNWTNVLNKDDSYDEASCTIMFLYAYSKGVLNGILDESYKDTAKKAWMSICDKFLDKEGGLSGICAGSGCSENAGYYDTLRRITNDEHGTGMFLAAACEYYRLLNN